MRPYGFSLIVLCCAALSVSGCRSVFDPSFMPAGYTYHQNTYKAPTGPKAPEIGYEYNAAYNDQIVDLWRSAARDVLDAFEAETGLIAQPVFIEKLPHTTALNGTIDHVLREELAARGYSFASFEGNHLHLRYDAYHPDDQEIVYGRKYNDDPEIVQKPGKPSDSSAFEIKLEGFRKGASLGHVTRQYTMPAYGYVSGKGRHPDRPLPIREVAKPAKQLPVSEPVPLVP
jgi:hypothetical protein